MGEKKNSGIIKIIIDHPLKKKRSPGLLTIQWDLHISGPCCHRVSRLVAHAGNGIQRQVSSKEGHLHDGDQWMAMGNQDFHGKDVGKMWDFWGGTEKL